MNGCMASACATVVVPVAPAAAWTSPACPSKKSTASSRRSVSCRATTGSRDDGNDGLLWLPRRDVLTTGLTAGLAMWPGLASAALEAEPCNKGDPVNDKLVECTDPRGGKIPCPPLSTAPIVDFTPEGAVKRVRQPVHRLTAEYQAKYREAVAKMKALPESHPLGFAEQAAIHEAYCDGHYRYDPASKDRPFDVHFSWVFAPWHRMYIYFYERALGELIGDDTFALPYWSWDVPAGMVIPPLFRDSPASNALYDRFRDMAHLDKLVDLHFIKHPNKELIAFDGPHDGRYKSAVNKNLCTMYYQQIRGGKGARAFLGEKLCTEVNKDQDEKIQSQGTLERMAHSAMHVWAGRGSAEDPSTCVIGHDGEPYCVNDMGFLGSAGRDPLFYSHHANVDRLWHLWATMLGGEGFGDKEWLDASFVFFDGVDDPRRVRIKFRDVLDTRNLGYTYAEAEPGKPLPWLDCKLTRLVPQGKGRLRRQSLEKAGPALTFPLTLKKNEVVEVPGVAVPAATQPGQQRVLVIKGIEYDPRAWNKFDVAINVPRESAAKVGPQYTEYAGSFTVVPSSKAGGGKLKGKVSLYIDQVLADVKTDGESTVDVVIVPRTEGEIKLYNPPTIQNQDE